MHAGMFMQPVSPDSLAASASMHVPGPSSPPSHGQHDDGDGWGFQEVPLHSMPQLDDQPAATDHTHAHANGHVRDIHAPYEDALEQYHSNGTAAQSSVMDHEVLGGAAEENAQLKQRLAHLEGVCTCACSRNVAAHPMPVCWTAVCLPALSSQPTRAMQDLASLICIGRAGKRGLL